VAYRSFASNSIPDDTNSSPDIFLYDHLTGSNTLVSFNRPGTVTGNNWSLLPWFSGDGQTLVFQSLASDILVQDFNHASDVIAYSVSRDSDGDGMDDQWELDNFGTLSRNGTGDFDGDGASDLFEFQAGTDPKNPASVFRAFVVYSGTPGPAPTIAWPVAAGKSYRVQFKNDLRDSGWQDLSGGVTVIGTNGFAYDLAPATGQRFYRVMLNN
jgi:hypothetical protein